MYESCELHTGYSSLHSHRIPCLVGFRSTLAQIALVFQKIVPLARILMSGSRKKDGQEDIKQPKNPVRIGIVTAWNGLKGYGFITDYKLDSCRRIYVHCKNVRGRYNWLLLGSRVSFRVALDDRDGKKRHKAVNVQVMRPPKPTSYSFPPGLGESIGRGLNYAGQWEPPTVTQMGPGSAGSWHGCLPPACKDYLTSLFQPVEVPETPTTGTDLAVKAQVIPSPEPTSYSFLPGVGESIGHGPNYARRWEPKIVTVEVPITVAETRGGSDSADSWHGWLPVAYEDYSTSFLQAAEVPETPTTETDLSSPGSSDEWPSDACPEWPQNTWPSYPIFSMQ